MHMIYVHVLCIYDLLQFALFVLCMQTAFCFATNPVHQCWRPPEGGRIPRRVYFQMSYFQESRGSSAVDDKMWDG